MTLFLENQKDSIKTTTAVKYNVKKTFLAISEHLSE